uniref:Uncharacterized protein n=1 Tax=Manihot esculenta TaxID=3983 RepID=A0A2C9VIY1_MANES
MALSSVSLSLVSSTLSQKVFSLNVPCSNELPRPFPLAGVDSVSYTTEATFNEESKIPIRDWEIMF